LLANILVMAPLCSAVPGRRGGVWARRVLPLGLLPDTPEEHQRRDDAAVALWRELVRRVAEKT
jgi:hypothetical protein